MNKLEKYWALCMLLTFWGYELQAQEDCKDGINYSISNVTINGGQTGYIISDDQSLQVTIGQTYVGKAGSRKQGITGRAGIWGYYELEPQAPIAKASQGEYIDRIEVEWEIVDDYVGPVVTEEITKIFRNGRLITSVPLKQTTYVDYNVFPGEFYTYEIVTTNSYGDAKPMEAVGFLNPNGRMTGTVESRLGTPVADVKVTLTPNLGRSLDLDGVDDYAYFMDQSFEFGDYYTIEGWWRNVEVKDQTIFVAVDSGTSTPVVKISLDDEGRIHYYHDGDANGEGLELISKYGYNLDNFSRAWHHFAVVYDTLETYLYVDGQRVAKSPTQDPITVTTELEFGKSGPNTYESYFMGQLDEFRVWDIGRTREQIRKYKDITLTGEEDYLAHYWKFDEQYSDKLFDFAEVSVADREHGFICGVTRSDFISPAQLGAYTDGGGDYLIKGIYYGNGTTFQVSPSKETPIGYSLDFDGVDDFISFNLDRINLDQAFTLEGWFKTDVDKKEMTFFEISDDTGTEMLLQIGLQSTGELTVSSGFGGSLGSFISSELYNDEFWYHYGLVHNGSSLTIYLDGQVIGSISDGPISNITARTVIGRSGTLEYEAGESYFEGWLDEIRLWDYARSSTQINATINQIIPGDEQGIVDPDGELGLEAYWMLGEGRGTLITDVTPNNHTGNLKNPQLQQVSSDEYLVKNWDGDNIPLDVEYFVHDYDPNARNVSLDPSNISVDRVDFTDISQLSVSGFVRYDGTNCFADSVEVFVNGNPTLPRTFTNDAGKFIVEFEPGATSQFLSFKLNDHNFDPGFIELPRLVRPLSGLSITDTKKRELKGRVVGGSCGYSIGEAKVILSTSPFCYTDTASVDEFGNFEFSDIPPLNYIGYIEHSDPTVQSFFDQEGAIEIDLTQGDDTVDFIYRSPLNVSIKGLEPDICSSPLVKQNEKVNLDIYTYEVYGNDSCIVDIGTYKISDNISDRDQIELDFNSSSYTYEMFIGEPNTLDGGTNPYQKNIQVIAEDTLGRQAEINTWATVIGSKSKLVNFATTTPQIPFIILRAPPGDQSYIRLEKGTTIGTSISFSKERSTNQGLDLNLHLGLKTTTSAGIGFSYTTDIESKYTISSEFEATQSNISETEQSLEFTTTDAYQTEGTSDVYVGGALNILYGTTDILEIDSGTCSVNVYEDVILVPDGFNTTFVYSKDFIEQTVVPELFHIGDTTSAETWLSFIKRDSMLQAQAVLKENISFDASSSFERVQETVQTDSYTESFEMTIDETFAISSGFTFNKTGLSGEVSAGFGFTNGKSKTSEKTSTIVTEYLLADDDFGDNYTVNIYDEPVYGTPVFKLISAATSCPWEGGLKREAVRLTSDKNSAINIPEDQSAVFKLNLGNISETRESGTYNLTLLAESNPNGAVVKVNGVPLSGEQDITYTLQPDENIEVTMTVEKGPESFEYSGLQMMLYSACEKEWADFRGYNIPEEPFASIIDLDVSFIEVCSPITIFDPGDDFVITQANNNSLDVVLTDYVIDRTDFTDVKLQYREKIEGQPWINAVEIVRADLDPGNTVLQWDVTNLDDGVYEIRAMTFCDAVPDPRSSEILKGTIDREAPKLFGTASPADGVLSADDEISIQFNENIQCGDIVSLGIPVSLTQGELNNVALSNTETGLFIDAIVSCEDNKLIIVPDIQNKFLEEKVLRVDVLGMTDELGNVQMQTETWEFLVRRNPLTWQGGDIQSVVYEGDSPQFIRQIKNNGAFAVNVNLSGELDVQTLDETSLPSWLSASPRSFTLQPGATQDVTFTVSNQIGGGSYVDMVTAATSFGAPELRFDVRVLCEDQGWAVNASDFEYSTTLTGQLDIRGDLSTDIYDQVAAFVGDELRGVGEVVYAPELEAIPGEHPYLVFMTIYSNSTNTEEIDFQVWDASRCQLYGQVSENYDIGATSISIGSPTSPATITVTNNVVQKLSLNKGWNWISFNLDMESSKINDVLGTLQNTDRGAIIKSQSQYSQFVPSLGWVGPLSKIDSTKAYRVKLTANDVLEVKGMPTDFETTFVELDSGWNWVSFLPPVGMEINEALTSLTATADFIIKGQKEFAQYVDFQGWIGSLDFLRPNQGYLIYTDRSQTLEYPVNDENARIEIPEEQDLTLPNGWTLNPSEFEFNANYIIRIDGAEIREGDILGLFNDENLVGIGEAQYLDFSDEYIFFVTAYSNSHTQLLSAVVAREGSKLAFEDQSLEYRSDQVFGTVKDPVLLQSEAILGAKMPKLAIDLYPNPGELSTTLSLSMITSKNVEISVQNLMGQTMFVKNLGQLTTGNHEIAISRYVNNKALSSGIYFIRIKVGSEVYTEKLVWK